LIFVGCKMLVSHWYHVPVTVSLPVIALLLVLAVGFSMQRNRRLDAGH
jgi:predicted tellurium resistance membrane protein TerC